MRFISANWLQGPAIRLAGHELYRHCQTRLYLQLSHQSQTRRYYVQRGEARVRVIGKAIDVTGWSISGPGNTAKLGRKFAVKSQSGKWYRAA